MNEKETPVWVDPKGRLMRRAIFKHLSNCWEGTLTEIWRDVNNPAYSGTCGITRNRVAVELAWLVEVGVLVYMKGGRTYRIA